jgi:hypothetical protein
MKKTETKEKRSIGEGEAPVSRKEVKQEKKKGERNISKVSERVGEKQPLSPEGQAAQSESFEAWPMAGMLDSEPYVGADSTAVQEVTILYEEEEKKDPQVEIVNTWLEKLARGNVKTDDEVKAGIELARDVSADYNRFLNLSSMTLAGRAILLGKVLLPLKNMVRGTGILWGPWAEQNLPFINKRNREKFMMLGKRTDCHRFAFLGVDRLELLCVATKDSKERDPIGKLLDDYKIPFDEKSEINLAEFKLLVDSALNMERLHRYEIKPNMELVKNLTQIGTQFDKSFLGKLKDIKESGGNPETYLNKLSMNRGEEVHESEGEKRLQDFNTLSNRLIKTIDYLIKDEDQLAKVEKKTLDLLFEKLLALRETANPVQVPLAA